MITTDPNQPPSARAIELGHQPDAVGYRGVLRFIVFLIIIAIAIHAAIWAFLVALRERRPPDVTPIASPSPVPKWSVHWADPSADLIRTRAREDQRLESAGWIDRERGIAHIPIESAMELVAQGRRPGPVEAPAAAGAGAGDAGAARPPPG